MSDASQRPIPAPGSFWNKLLGILDLTHPFPMIMNALLAGLFMYMASPNVAYGRLLVLVLSVAGIHGSFGSLSLMSPRSSPSIPRSAASRGQACPVALGRG